MGLDGVCLVMAVEEEFGVTLTDGECAYCETPGQLIQIVASKLDFSRRRVCPSLRGFHLVRAALIETLGIHRSKVKLDTVLRSLADPSQDQKIANRLRSILEARTGPSLGRPRSIKVILGFAALATFASSVFYLPAFVAVILGLTMLIGGLRVTKPFSRYFPRGARVRDLVPQVKTSGWIARDRRDVATRIREIVIDQLGIRPDQYREDAHFVRDLGMD